VKPLKVVVTRDLSDFSEELQDKTGATKIRMDRRVQNEAMNSAIPREIDKADELVAREP